MHVCKLTEWQTDGKRKRGKSRCLEKNRDKQISNNNKNMYLKESTILQLEQTPFRYFCSMYFFLYPS